jgi:ribose transport system permease protein
MTEPLASRGFPPKRASYEKSVFVSFFTDNLGTLAGLLVLCIFLSFSTSSFLTETNILNVLRQISIVAIIAFGMTAVILIGGIDLSVGSVLAAAGVAAVYLFVVTGLPMPIALLAGVAAGALFGFVNGFLSAVAAIPPFIVTLGMMSTARGFAYVITGGKPTGVDDPVFFMIGNGYVGGAPVPVLIMAVIFVAMVVLLRNTKFGRDVYAMGGNKEAAKFAGIRVKAVEIKVYVLCGALSGVAGIISASRMSSAQPIAGQGIELDAIAAVVLGGTSFKGGIGTVEATLIGALIIGVLNNGLNLLHVPFFWQLVIKGAVIVFAVYLDTLKKSRE